MAPLPPVAAGTWNGVMATPLRKDLSGTVAAPNVGAASRRPQHVDLAGGQGGVAGVGGGQHLHRQLGVGGQRAAPGQRQRCRGAAGGPARDAGDGHVRYPRHQLEAGGGHPAAEGGAGQRHRYRGVVQGGGGEGGRRVDDGGRRLVVVHRHRHAGEGGGCRNSLHCTSPQRGGG